MSYRSSRGFLRHPVVYWEENWDAVQRRPFQRDKASNLQRCHPRAGIRGESRSASVGLDHRDGDSVFKSVPQHGFHAVRDNP